MQYNYNYMKKIFEDKGYILLDNEYKNLKQKVNYICKKHKEFGVQTTTYEQAVNYNKQCRICKNQEILNRSRYNIMSRENGFIELCHKNKWIYQGYNVEKGYVYIYYICLNHIRYNVQRIREDHLLEGVKCPYCDISKGEHRIEEWCSLNGIKNEREKTFTNCRDKELLRFDFYLPDYNVCIEYNGEQHYKPSEYFGGNKIFKKQQKRDNIKRKYCKENNIKLIEIPYTQFKDIENILNNMLKSLETAGN